MGPSGSGKSTLLHCLAGILVPDSGEVVFEGRRVDAMSEEERSALRRDRFGFVFQFGQLVPELTVEENVALPLLFGGTRRRQALAAARLRLTGAPLAVLGRVLAMESAVPLGAVAAVSAATGFLASALFLRSELGESLRPPGDGYYLIVLAGLLASLALIACTFPLLKRITGPETARNE